MVEIGRGGMQFIQGGPDIPDELLLAHEEGRVVFFCGAGISYPAGLPGFGGLVSKIHKRLGAPPSAVEEKAYSLNQFDAGLDLLQRRLPYGRKVVRSALAQELKPKLRKPNASSTHAAILTLALCPDGSRRVVTTNFDRIFAHVIRRDRLNVNTYAAPTLPIPKNSRWNGLVYLHGLLPDSDDESELNRLIVTSGDFGLAYLTERWAARFVSELFRSYVVCFVGYSINDPVLRYMMDALAADRMLGEITPTAFAFGDFAPGEEVTKTDEWEAKGVRPILYEVPAGTHDHSKLHKTIASWSETHRDGIQGRERLIANYAGTRPAASTREDDYVGRLLWALSHQSGLPARRFAEHDPAPSLDWLAPFSQQIYRHSDLARFAVTADREYDEKLEFSLINRPSPYALAPRMSLLNYPPEDARWDAVMTQLANWLIRHLGDPALILWLADRGRGLHPRLAVRVQSQLDKISKLQTAGDSIELARITAGAPRAIPDHKTRIYWRLLLTSRVRAPNNRFDLYDWKARLSSEGLTTSVRLQLRELLAPMVKLSRGYAFAEAEDSGALGEGIDPIEAEVILASDHPRHILVEHDLPENWALVLLEMFDDFVSLLHDATGLQQETGYSTADFDRSHWDMPSISDHWQNRGYKDWVLLVELVRDSWLKLYERDLPSAHAAAFRWISMAAVFKRLALFAASSNDVTPNGEWVDWLIERAGWWLWSTTTQREVMRLLVLQGMRLPDHQLERLEDAILQGPPREMFRADLEAEQWQAVVEHSTWLRLAKLASSGRMLRFHAQTRLQQLAEANGYSLSDAERDEFSHWMSGTGDPDYEDSIPTDVAPNDRRGLTAWLRAARPGIFADNWRDMCRNRFVVAAAALMDLGRQREWPVGRWREALQVWSDADLAPRSWRRVGPLVASMPDQTLEELAHGVSWWLQSVAKVKPVNERRFRILCSRLMAFSYDEDQHESRDPLSSALNHPIGMATQALLDQWFDTDLRDGQTIPDDLREIFSLAADREHTPLPHGRVILASRLITLLRVDADWTNAHLLPHFSWEQPRQAAPVWSGFLWSPRLYRPVIAALSPHFLATARHYGELGSLASQYARLLTYIGLEMGDIFSSHQIADAVATLPTDGLHEVVKALIDATESAAEKREEYFANRIKPFWTNAWPKNARLVSTQLSESLTLLTIASGNHFPEAIQFFTGWIGGIEHSHYAIHRLLESQHPTNHPEASLRLLALIVRDEPWISSDLETCLQRILTAWPPAAEQQEYRRLLTQFRRNR